MCTIGQRFISIFEIERSDSELNCNNNNNKNNDNNKNTEIVKDNKLLSSDKNYLKQILIVI